MDFIDGHYHCPWTYCQHCQLFPLSPIHPNLHRIWYRFDPSIADHIHFRHNVGDYESHWCSDLDAAGHRCFTRADAGRCAGRCRHFWGYGISLQIESTNLEQHTSGTRPEVCCLYCENYINTFD